MSQQAHLDELRSRLIVTAAAFLMAFGLTAWQSDLVLEFLNAPLPGEFEPITLGPSEPFITTLKTAGYAALLLVLPVFIYQAYASSCRRSSRGSARWPRPLVLVPVLFIAGVAFCYLVCSPRRSTSS